MSYTTYTGNTLQDMKSIIWCGYKRIKKPSSVWMDDATYKDVSGKPTFNQKETELVTSILSRTGKTFQKINSRQLTSFLKLQEQFHWDTCWCITQDI